MIYCTRCIYPSTKPDLTFNADGVCSACTSFDARQTIDWEGRAREWRRFVSDTQVEADARGAPYDCIVPVSGGKDSTYQVLKALESGLRVLAVTAETDHLSEIGRRNLDNIGRLGVDHIEVKTNPVLRRKVNRYTLLTIGDVSWAEHITIFTIPVRVASMMRIPLILWGENPQNEYGGPSLSQAATELSQDWLNEFGGLNGLRLADVEMAIGDLGEVWHYPNAPGELRKVRGVFLGQFFPWDGKANAELAARHGFELHHEDVEGSVGAYENLDNLQTGIHDYFKFLKFGFGRATDILCNHIRRNRITRAEAIEIARKRDGMFPASYLGVPLRTILEPLDMSVDVFLDCCDTFTNQDLFTGTHVDATIATNFTIGGNHDQEAS